MHRLAVIKGVQRMVVDALSLDRVSEQYHVLIINYISFMLYTTLESVFVNTLLFTIRNDISIVVWYRGAVFVSTAIMMHLAAYIGQKKSPLVVIRLGGALYLATYVVLFAGMNHMGSLMMLVAVLSGTGAAFYWTGHNVLVPHYSTKFNRDIGIAILGIIQGVMTLVIPVISGFVISLMTGNLGYRVMFGIGMLTVAVQMITLKKLPAVQQEQHVSQARLAWKLLVKKASCQLMLLYEFLRGLRDGAFAFLLNMVLFEIITSESLVGINTFVTGVCAIVGSWAFGRVVRPTMRARVVIIAAAIVTVTSLPLLVRMSAPTVMVYSAISSFFSLFITYSCNNTTFDVVVQNDVMRRSMGELLAFREGAMAVGRVVGLSLLMILPHTQRGYVQAILLLSSTQVLCGVVIWLTQRLLNRKQDKPAPQVPVGEPS